MVLLGLPEWHSLDFPGGPVAGTPCSQRRDPGFDAGSGS